MKTTLLTLALLLATSALAAPSAQAADRCTFLQDWCPGLVCTYHKYTGWSCVGETCTPQWCLVPDPEDVVVPDPACNETWCVVWPWPPTLA